MSKMKKKGTSGAAKNYITRTQAVRKLQVSLPDFRRLCIFKGIYPREPRNKKKANKRATPSTTFYYTKDIQYLLHEPLLQKFRDHKALAKKISRALGRGNPKDAARLEKIHTPKMRIDHIIRERYPTFEDALRDLDDALSMLYLFASLPSTVEVPGKTIALCQRLCREFEHYLITSHSLRKSFLSIKGIYYQATIHGQDVMWIVPYRFVQRGAQDVDFRIMGTFVDFYSNLIGFVNYRLYTGIGLVYPPKFDAKKDDEGAELSAYSLEARNITAPKEIAPSHSSGTINPKAQAIADALANESTSTHDDLMTDVPQSNDENQEGEDEEAEQDPAAAADAPFASSSLLGSLFADLSVWISREAPRQPLELLLRAFGCKRIGWESTLGEGAFKSDEKWTGWTHQIVDRPQLTGPAAASRPSQARVPGRLYVQPQWVWDCVNAGEIVSADLYAPGATLPPHLSPWVKVKEGEYDPTKPLVPTEEEGLLSSSEDEEEEEEEEEEEVERDDDGRPVAGKTSAVEVDSDDEDAAAGEGMDVDTEDSDDDNDDDEGERSEDEDGAKHVGKAASEAQSADEHDSEPEASEDELHQAELAAEATGTSVNGAVSKFTSHSAGSTHGSQRSQKQETLRKQKARAQREAEEELERRKGMMSNKKRKQYENMERRQKKVTAEAEKLMAKRQKIEKEKEKARRKVGGKTA